MIIIIMERTWTDLPKNQNNIEDILCEYAEFLPVKLRMKFFSSHLSATVDSMPLVGRTLN